MRAGVTHASQDRRWRRVLRGYLLLPHVLPVLMVELATAAFATIAWRGVPPLGVLALLLLAMLGGQLAIGANNELIDLPIDSLTKPAKPLVRGDVSVRGAQFMVGAGLILMTLCGLMFGPTAFALLVLGTGFGFAYNRWLKRTIWSWLPYFLALPLLPIWVFAALGRPAAPLLFLYPLGALATAGVHFAQALPDVAADRAAGLRNASSRWGEKKTFVAAWLFTLATPAIAWLASARLGERMDASPLVAAAAVGLALVGANLAVLAANWRIGVLIVFPMVGLTTLASGLAWAMTIAEQTFR